MSTVVIGRVPDVRAATAPRLSVYWPSSPLFFWEGLPLPEEVDSRWQRALVELYDVGVAAGRALGYSEGYQAAEGDMAALQREAVAVNEAYRKLPTYARLCEIRGEHSRAQIQRDLLRKGGAQEWQLA